MRQTDEAEAEGALLRHRAVGEREAHQAKVSECEKKIEDWAKRGCPEDEIPELEAMAQEYVTALHGRVDTDNAMRERDAMPISETMRYREVGADEPEDDSDRGDDSDTEDEAEPADEVAEEQGEAEGEDAGPGVGQGV